MIKVFQYTYLCIKKIFIGVIKDGDIFLIRDETGYPCYLDFDKSQSSNLEELKPKPVVEKTIFFDDSSKIVSHKKLQNYIFGHRVLNKRLHRHDVQMKITNFIIYDKVLLPIIISAIRDFHELVETIRLKKNISQQSIKDVSDTIVSRMNIVLYLNGLEQVETSSIMKNILLAKISGNGQIKISANALISFCGIQGISFPDSFLYIPEDSYSYL